MFPINAIQISPEVASSGVGCGPCTHNHLFLSTWLINNACQRKISQIKFGSGRTEDCVFTCVPSEYSVFSCLKIIRRLNVSCIV